MECREKTIEHDLHKALFQHNTLKSYFYRYHLCSKCCLKPGFVMDIAAGSRPCDWGRKHTFTS